MNKCFKNTKDKQIAYLQKIIIGTGDFYRKVDKDHLDIWYQEAYGIYFQSNGFDYRIGKIGSNDDFSVYDVELCINPNVESAKKRGDFRVVIKVYNKTNELLDASIVC